jgi:hypothetical protein
MLKASGPFADDESKGYSESEIERKKIGRAWQQSEIDGFVYTNTTEQLGHKSIRFYITLNGVIALESCPFPFRLRPYR